MACSKMSVKLDKLLKCWECKEIVENPVTLSCFHSFCRHCLDKINMPEEPETMSKKETDGKETAASRNETSFIYGMTSFTQGMTCPLCNGFTADSKLQTSQLITQLLDMHYRLQQADEKCQQCYKCEGKWNCVDCKMALCEECKVNHLRIPMCKFHTITEINCDENSKVDSLMFCKLHKADPLQFNCRDCEEAICMKCNSTNHKHHKTETVEDTLARLVPGIQENVSKLRQKISDYEESQENIAIKVYEVKQEFDKCEEEAQNNLNEIIKLLRKQHSEFVKQIQMKKEEQLNKLEIACDKIESMKRQCMQISSWAETSVNTAKGVTLVAELQSGLCVNIVHLLKGKPEKPVKIETPILKPNAALLDTKDMIGKLAYKFSNVSGKIFRKYGKVVPSLPQLFESEYETSKEALTISLPSRATRMNVINRELWVPIPKRNMIKIYSLLNGDFIKDVKNDYISKPRSVCQAENGEIILASDSGLHVIDEEGQILSTLMNGTFCDVSACEDKLYAINYNTPIIFQLTYIGCKWEQEQIRFGSFFSPEDTVESNVKYTIVTKEKQDRYIWIYKDMNIRKHKSYDFNDPFTCFRDQLGNFLIASYSHYGTKQCSYYNPETDTHKNVTITGLSGPCDCVCDEEENLWILDRHNYHITKYCVSQKNK